MKYFGEMFLFPKQFDTQKVGFRKLDLEFILQIKFTVLYSACMSGKYFQLYILCASLSNMKISYVRKTLMPEIKNAMITVSHMHAFY